METTYHNQLHQIHQDSQGGYHNEDDEQYMCHRCTETRRYGMLLKIKSKQSQISRMLEIKNPVIKFRVGGMNDEFPSLPHL